MNIDQPNEFGTLISQKIASESDTFYHHYDALGSTAALTDSSEVVTDEYDYEAFGETAAESGATPNPYQWVAQVGYRKDEETSLYDLRRRNYDVSTGRFVSEDPVRSDEENLYRYVGNDSVGETDPSGLKVRLSESTIQAMQRVFGAENLKFDGNIVSFTDPEAAAIASYNYVQDTGGSMVFRVSLWKAIADSDTYSFEEITSGKTDAILAPPESGTAKPRKKRKSPSPNSVSAFVQRPRPTGLGRNQTIAGPWDPITGWMNRDGVMIPITNKDLTFEFHFHHALQNTMPMIAIIVIGEAIPGPADEAAAIRRLGGVPGSRLSPRGRPTSHGGLEARRPIPTNRSGAKQLSNTRPASGTAGTAKVTGQVLDETEDVVINVASKSRLFGISNTDAKALDDALKAVKIDGKPAIQSVEAFGSRSGSTFRGRPPKPDSDFDIYITVRSEVGNSSEKLQAVIDDVNDIADLFGRSKGIQTNPIIEIDTLAPAHKLQFKDTPFIRLDQLE